MELFNAHKVHGPTLSVPLDVLLAGCSAPSARPTEAQQPAASAETHQCSAEA